MCDVIGIVTTCGMTVALGCAGSLASICAAGRLCEVMVTVT